MNSITAELRAIESRLEALCNDPGTRTPQSTRALLRSASGVVMVARWQVEDRDEARLTRVLAGDGSDI